MPVRLGAWLPLTRALESVPSRTRAVTLLDGSYQGKPPLRGHVAPGPPVSARIAPGSALIVYLTIHRFAIFDGREASEQHSNDLWGLNYLVALPSLIDKAPRNRFR